HKFLVNITLLQFLNIPADQANNRRYSLLIIEIVYCLS
ncbi:MAG: hypothetical protein ACI93S_000393, partial [Ancylomarina sp.]